MGTREIVCGREVASYVESGVSAGPVGRGWYRPFSYSPEFVMYVSGNPLGEVYQTPQETWVSRLYPHHGKEYDTQDEAMLFLEAIAALAG